MSWFAYYIKKDQSPSLSFFSSCSAILRIDFFSLNPTNTPTTKLATAILVHVYGVTTYFESLALNLGSLARAANGPVRCRDSMKMEFRSSHTTEKMSKIETGSEQLFRCSSRAQTPRGGNAPRRGRQSTTSALFSCLAGFGSNPAT